MPLHSTSFSLPVPTNSLSRIPEVQQGPVTTGSLPQEARTSSSRVVSWSHAGAPGARKRDGPQSLRPPALSGTRSGSGRPIKRPAAGQPCCCRARGSRAEGPQEAPGRRSPWKSSLRCAERVRRILYSRHAPVKPGRAGRIEGGAAGKTPANRGIRGACSAGLEPAAF